MIRVAVVTPSLRGGGLERVVRDLVLAVDRKRFSPAVFCINGVGTYGADVRQAGIAVHDCTERALRLRGVPLKLLGALRRFAPHIIHAHSGTWLPSSVARWLLRRPHLIFTDHGRYPPEPYLRSVVERWCFRRTDRLVAVSRHLARYVERYLRLDRPPEVIFNGIDLSQYSSERPHRRRLRTQWGIRDHEVLAIAVGRLDPVKNHAHLLRALARAGAEATGLRLAVLGQGPLGEELRALVGRLGLDDRVRLLGFRRDVAACLEAADLFVMPSLTEGLPVSLIEGLAAGLPVVASDVGGIPEVVGDPPAGILVHPEDEAALADALVKMTRSDHERRTLGVRAAARARVFSLDAMTAGYEVLYETVRSVG